MVITIAPDAKKPSYATDCSRNFVLLNNSILNKSVIFVVM